jgi:hypothetical protein
VASSSKDEYTPSIASDRNGNFVVAWTLEYSSSDEDVLARRYTASGGALSGIITVSGTSASETYPDVARAPDGRFAVSYASDNGNGDVILKRYANTGTLVNTHSIATGTSQQLNPRISMDRNANTMVVWQEMVGSDYDIKARRVSNTGVRGTVLGVAASTRQEVLPNVGFKRDGTAFAVTFYDMTQFRTHVTEMTIAGAYRYRTNTGYVTVIDRASIAFGVGSSYQFVYSRPNGSAGWDVFRRRGSVS